MQILSAISLLQIWVLNIKVSCNLGIKVNGSISLKLDFGCSLRSTLKLSARVKYKRKTQDTKVLDSSWLFLHVGWFPCQCTVFLKVEMLCMMLTLVFQCVLCLQLEEGEIDVRFHSFKGCVLEKVSPWTTTACVILYTVILSMLMSKVTTTKIITRDSMHLTFPVWHSQTCTLSNCLIHLFWPGLPKRNHWE